MLVTVLYSMEGNPAVSGELTFKDVAKDAWYYNAVLWATQKGIIGGYSADKFGPNDTLTREQMALILNGYARIRLRRECQGGCERFCGCEIHLQLALPLWSGPWVSPCCPVRTAESWLPPAAPPGLSWRRF